MIRPIVTMMLAALCVTLSMCQSGAFPFALPTRFASPASALQMTRGGGAGNPFDGGELTSALARLDQQWKIQQKTKGKSRWSKLILPSDDKDESFVEQDPTRQTQQEFVYLLEPESSIPSCIIVFVGGAGLGQFPHIAYSEFLMRVSNRLNAAVLAAPYPVGLDHFTLAKTAGECLRKGVLRCEENPALQYPSTLPTYCIAHSLGAKLQTIYMGATGQNYDGVGYISYNNFSFSQTIAMARVFAQQLRNSQNRLESDTLNGIFDLAETAIGVLGVDFSPKPADMERLIELKFNSDLQRKTRLFVFDEDTMDSSKSFVESCSDGSPSLSGLPGNHLTPVYLKFGLDDLPEETRGMAASALGDVQSASYGNEQDLNTLVDEVCGWILGKGPTRGPDWDGDASRQPQRRISGGVADHP